MSEEMGDGRISERPKEDPKAAIFTWSPDLANADSPGGVIGKPAVLGACDKSEPCDEEGEDIRAGVERVAERLGGEEES